MNILSIGNSFSMDATRYLHQIARADGVNIQTLNLYIGGCPLYFHFKNMMSNQKAYTLGINGMNSGFYVSIEEALLNREWDYVTFQQVSTESMNYDTYQPYLTTLSEYARRLAPKSKQLIHETWAYEEGIEILATWGITRNEMHLRLNDAYKKAAADISAEFIIPSGDVMQRLGEKGVTGIYRDGRHASLGSGRYALGLTWYRALTGRDVTDNTFNDFDEAIESDTVKIIKETVMEVLL